MDNSACGGVGLILRLVCVVRGWSAQMEMLRQHVKHPLGGQDAVQSNSNQKWFGALRLSMLTVTGNCSRATCDEPFSASAFWASASGIVDSRETSGVHTHPIELSATGLRASEDSEGPPAGKKTLACLHVRHKKEDNILTMKYDFG
eukprot:9487640-Pyramimonas_sp.AAC.3